jgi:hypothetical protein
MQAGARWGTDSGYDEPWAQAGQMNFARFSADSADHLFGWHSGGEGTDNFWLIFTFLGVEMSQKFSVPEIASLVP